ncbi:hypothetical protein [endosymbiont of Lamellibrachia barhami]|uniref:hypothetical protein n=1 Tax=endosymbiont of Lamellibrachia barhami TaxID=205975 RepID=UPI0015ACC2D5|nr:hypothetical protein [endosymbiont of Lamellibrachia barhami]
MQLDHHFCKISSSKVVNPVAEYFVRQFAEKIVGLGRDHPSEFISSSCRKKRSRSLCNLACQAR